MNERNLQPIGGSMTIAAPKRERRHSLRIIDSTGDTKLTWARSNDDEVANARKTFKRLKKQGYMAYTVKRGGDRGEVLNEFDENAQAMILVPPMVGG